MTTTPSRTARWLYGSLGFLIVLVSWQVAAQFLFAEGATIPRPGQVFAQLLRDGWELYGPNIITTGREAAKGWLLGNAVAMLLALVVVQSATIERFAMRIAVAAYFLPVVVLAPILAILFTGDWPMVVIAAMTVFFPTLVLLLVGLKTAEASSLEVVRCCGGRRLTELRKVRLPASVPSLFTALRLAAPGAVLGAVIGEYGGAEKGLGVLMINAQQSLEVERTWGVAIVLAGLVGVAYGATVLTQRLVAPWSMESRHV
ncbi:ABC transporter permease subunit [Kribbella turkmenica]|uniref:ABC transporter permease subunit n=1 Tax=Kribbella turkmenica TaxID=2530375 RepID=A0A4V6PDC2_9ACTN|nr:ABC transporter permease subunit [Kribbella turkmenica]TDD29207.1 ABC transporter permease subunit [Kribbella turkmenica]